LSAVARASKKEKKKKKKKMFGEALTELGTTRIIGIHGRSKGGVL